MNTYTRACGFLGTLALAAAFTTAPIICAAQPSTAPAATTIADTAKPLSYIVQAQSLASARAAVTRVGGRITQELGIIEAVGATLTAQQAETLRSVGGINVFADQQVKTMGGGEAYQIPLMGVDKLQAQGINGLGVTVAVLDTGTWDKDKLVDNPAGQRRIRAVWDAITSKAANDPSDSVGHGSHVASIILSSNLSSSGKAQGIAPYAGLVSVRAFDNSGKGSYATVINGLNWLLTNRIKYNIRVLNLSFGAIAQSSYWSDPLNQAVMKLWQAGVVVVASAGNWGPYAQTITVPGNLPYVITVGAMTDNFTPTNTSDDRLASFSGTGPTLEGFVKPEIVAPGGHLIGLMDGTKMSIPLAHPEFATADKSQFVMSGTSQAAAAVSGTVALMLQAQPLLTPDQVKCKLMSSARAAVDATGKLAYSVFQQGAGMINAYAAVYNPYSSCGNTGLDIAADIAGSKHFGGPAHQAADGTYYITDGNGQAINTQGFLWNNGYLWNQSYTPSVTSYAGINSWVNQE
jgi:serine protease AprX